MTLGQIARKGLRPFWTARELAVTRLLVRVAEHDYGFGGELCIRTVSQLSAI